MSETKSEMLADTGALEHLDDEIVDSLHEMLLKHGFDADFISRAESIAPGQLDQVRLPVVHWWLRRERSPAALLARLFAYADPIAAEELEETFPPGVAEALLEVGLLHRGDDGITSTMRVMPFESLWIASDEMNAPEDPVMGPGATTLQLARAMGVSAGASILDVGCGAGTLALVASARGAGRVVGVDLMVRAIEWSRFNARLNRLSTVFEAGDLTQPVAGQRFDLVVSQPPFVIQPEGTEQTTYLHGGKAGDEITLRLLGELPDVLGDDGRAVVLFDAPRLSEAPIDKRLNSAIGDSQLQLHAVTAKGHSADQQSIAYSSVQHPDLGASYHAAVRETREHLEALGIEGSDHVLLHVRRAPSGEDQRTVVLETDALRKWDHVMLDELALSASFATRSDDELMTCAVRVPPRTTLIQESSFDQPEKQRLKLHFESGRASDFELSDAAAIVVEAAREGATVETLVKHFADAAGALPAEMRPKVLAFIRQALLLGLVKPE